MVMGSPQNWAPVVTAEQFFQQSEKRLAIEERRQKVTKASDLLGPLAGAVSTEVTDLGGPATFFNGNYVVPPGSIGGPDDTKWWIGSTVLSELGGIQTASTFMVADAPQTTYQRSFTFAPDNPSVRYFGDWVQTSSNGGGDTGWVTLTAAAPFALNGSPAARKVGNQVTLRGYVSRASSSSTSFTAFTTLPLGMRPATSTFIPLGLPSGTLINCRAVVRSTGDIEIQMSADNSGNMHFSGLTFFTD